MRACKQSTTGRKWRRERMENLLRMKDAEAENITIARERTGPITGMDGPDRRGADAGPGARRGADDVIDVA